MFENLKNKLSGPDGNLLTKRNITGIIILVLILTAIPVGTYIVSQRTNLTPKAGGEPTMAITNAQDGYVATGNLDISINPGGGTTTPGQSTTTPTASARCDITPSCSGANCTFEVEFYKNNEKQSSGYEIAWQPNIGDTTMTGWLSLTTPNDKGEVATNSKVSHNYGNAADGPYTAKFIVRTADGLFASCQARVLTPASSAGGGSGADVGYDCSRSCNGRINAHVYKDVNGNGKKDGGSDGEGGIANVRINIKTTNNKGSKVNITKNTNGANGQALFECIPATDTKDEGVTYEVTVDKSTLPSGYSLDKSTVNGVNLDSCSDTDVANFFAKPN